MYIYIYIYIYILDYVLTPVHIYVYMYIYIYMYMSVLEINGALGARCAHFRGRAHVFRMCAPDVRTVFHSLIIVIY